MNRKTPILLRAAEGMLRGTKQRNSRPEQDC
jgi:hypothetical protein